MVYGNTVTELKVQEMRILPKIRVRMTKEDEQIYFYSKMWTFQKSTMN